MNGRLYDPVVGRFLSPDPFIADPSFSQSYNRYAYALNNPLKFTDPSGEKLKWPKFGWFNAIPVIGQFDYLMQFINDNTTKTRQKMVNAGVPDFGAGISFSGNGNINFSGSYRGQEVFNTNNINKGNPDVVLNELTQVRRDYGEEWMAASYPGIALTTTATQVSWMAAASSAAIVAMPFALAGDTRQEQQNYSYVIYLKQHPSGAVYVGRTSGFGTPEEVLRRRDAGHSYNDLGFGQAVVHSAVMNIGWAEGYPAMRGREQQVIDSFGGIGNPMIANKIRGVSQYRVITGRFYWMMSNTYYGPLWKYTGY